MAGKATEGDADILSDDDLLGEGDLYSAAWYAKVDVNRRLPAGDEVLLEPNPDGYKRRLSRLLGVIDTESSAALVSVPLVGCHSTCLGPFNLNVSGDLLGALQTKVEFSNPDSICISAMSGGGNQSPQVRSTMMPALGASYPDFATDLARDLVTGRTHEQKHEASFRSLSCEVYVAQKGDPDATNTITLRAFCLAPDLVVIGANGEVFAEIADRVELMLAQEGVTAAWIDFLNGNSAGYICTDVTHLEGDSYELTQTKHGPGAEKAVVNGALELVREVVKDESLQAAV